MGVIASPTRVAYFDTRYAEASLDAAQEARHPHLGYAVYSPRTLQDFYDWDPDTALPRLREGDLVGVECATWADTFRDGLTTAFLLTTARLPGFAERAWSRKNAADWDDYWERLAQQYPVWRHRE